MPYELRQSRTKSGRWRGKRFKRRSCSILDTLDYYVHLGRCVLIKGFEAQSLTKGFGAQSLAKRFILVHFFCGVP